MKKLILILALSPMIAFANVKGDLDKVEADTQRCLDQPDNGSTYGMKLCVDAGYQAADQILNNEYRTITHNLKRQTGDKYSDQLNAETLKRLVTAERTWISFRDSNSNLHGIEMLGGTGEGLAVIGTLLDMTKTRALELDSLLGSNQTVQ